MNFFSTLQKEDFDALLGWLSTDRDKAGEIYEEVRQGLIRFFRAKGCGDSESLADETINRVAVRVSTLDSSKNVKIITYFYGFAANILFEYFRASKKENVPLDAVINVETALQNFENEDADYKSSCLERCLNELSTEDKQIIIEYYSKEKLAKIEIRKKIAERLKCEINTLHVRIFRLRNTLGKCIDKCLKKTL